MADDDVSHGGCDDDQPCTDEAKRTNEASAVDMIVEGQTVAFELSLELRNKSPGNRHEADDHVGHGQGHESHMDRLIRSLHPPSYPLAGEHQDVETVSKDTKAADGWNQDPLQHDIDCSQVTS